MLKQSKADRFELVIGPAVLALPKIGWHPLIVTNVAARPN
jgi:hypothetical protein